MGQIKSIAGSGAAGNRNQKPTLNIQSLPNEILPFIFAHLPAEDCKNVRLTCKSWYEHSLDRAVSENQKFVFTESDSIEEIGKFLLRSSDVHVLNLEFHNLSIDVLPSFVWKKCGHQVHSLLFRGCDFGYASLADVVLYCVNLTSFITHNQNYYGVVDDNDVDANSPAELIDLIEKGLTRSKLRTFVWFHDDLYLPTARVKQIFSVFPCLTYFGLGPKPSYDYQLGNVGAGDDDQSLYTNFDECLDPSMPLRRIIFNKATDGSWMRRSILKPEWSSRLIELQTLLCYENLPDFGKDVLFTLFAVQKNLQVVTLNELKGDEAFAKELMFCIFENCLTLRELQLRFQNDDATGASLLLKSLTFGTYSEFIRFFSHLPKLECFVVNFDIELNFPSEMLASLPETDFAMERLHLDQSSRSEAFNQLVLKRCLKLKYLKLAVCFDDILQEVFKNTDLQTLILCTFLYHGPEHSKLTDYGFTGRRENESQQQGFSIKRLQKLEHLRIGIYDKFHVSTTGWQKQDDGIFTRRSGVTLKSIRELQFPRLKSLDLFLELELQLKVLENSDPIVTPDPNEMPSSLWYCHVKSITQLPGDILIHLASSLPAIEKLVISPAPEDFAAISKLCELSKHLSHLRCAQTDDIDVNSLFDTCPSLRHLELYDDGDEKRIHFRRHPLTNEIQYRVLQRRSP